MTTNKTLIVDLNNLAFVTRFSKLKTPKSRRKKDEYATNMILYGMLDATARHAKKFGCNSILVACDSKNPWRRMVYPDYKKGSKKKEDIYFEQVLEAADIFRQLMREKTCACVAAVENCEADDIIGWWCLNKRFQDEVVILSTDNDYNQLLSDTVSQFSITKKEFLQSQDPELDLFIKCIRGDKSDNIKSAYPRVRTTVLENAYEDDGKLLNLMETVLDDETKVGDNFEHNNALIDLSRIPEWVCSKIHKKISDYESATFSEIDIMSELAGIGLKSNSDMLEGRTKAFKTTPTIFN